MICDKKLLMLRPSELVIPSYRIRKITDPYELQRLAESIATSGMIQPLAVRKGEDGMYELIAGERRLKAALMAGLRRVPCILYKADDAASTLYALTENLQRSNLNCFEEAHTIEKLIKVYGMSQSEIGIRLGMSDAALSAKRRLLKLDSATQKRIVCSGLSQGYAEALLRLSTDQRTGTLDKIISENMTLPQARALIDEIINPKPLQESKPISSPAPYRKSSIADVRLFSNSLSKLVDTLRNAGIKANSRKYENDKYIEYKVRIKKEPLANTNAEQLKIC